MSEIMMSADAGEQVDAGSTENTEEFVPITEAEDADLDAFLEQGDEEAESEEELPVAQNTQEKQDKVSEKPEGDVPQEQPKAAPTREEFEKLVLEMKQKERFIQHRNTEVGELRKQLREAKARLAEGLEEEWQINPAEAHQRQSKLERVNAHIEQLEAEEEQNNVELAGRSVVQKYLTPQEFNIPAAVEMLAEDGLPPDLINRFKENPFRVAAPETLVHIFKRATAESIAKKIIPATRKLLEENVQLKKQLQESGGRVAQKIQEGLKRSAQVTSSRPSSASSKAELMSSDLSSLSEEELESLLKE